MKNTALNEIVCIFERILGPRSGHSIIESLLCTTAMSITECYPDNRHRQTALCSIVDAAYHLKKSEREGVNDGC
jgi:hypothetical protein